MEVVYGLCILFGILVFWFTFGTLVAYAGNFISRYFTAEVIFREDYLPLHPVTAFGPLLLIWCFYPVWLLIKCCTAYIYRNIGRTVVVENIKEYAYDYRHKCLGKASTKSLANFFNAYMDKDTNKFCHTNEGDRNALENFFRVDGWRNVGDGVWTKIVKVSDLNEQS